MKSIVALLLFWILPNVAARYGLLRVEEGPAFVNTRMVTSGSNHRDLLEEEMNLWTRQLFGRQMTDLPSSSFSVSMSIQLSLSMQWDGVTSSTNDSMDTPPSSQDSSSLDQTSRSASDSTSTFSLTDNAETGKNVLLGALLVAGVALIGVAVARKMRKDSTYGSSVDRENLSMQSETSVEGVDNTGRLL